MNQEDLEFHPEIQITQQVDPEPVPIIVTDPEPLPFAPEYKEPEPIVEP